MVTSAGWLEGVVCPVAQRTLMKEDGSHACVVLTLCLSAQPGSEYTRCWGRLTYKYRPIVIVVVSNWFWVICFNQ